MNYKDNEKDSITFTITPTPLSNERIRQLALQKRADYLKVTTSKTIKKTPKKFFVQIMVACMIICAISVSAFAFSQSATIQNLLAEKNTLNLTNSSTPLASKTVNGQTMRIENIATNGYTANVIVSIEGKNKIDIKSPDTNLDYTTELDVMTGGLSELTFLENGDKQYFNLSIGTYTPLNNAEMVINFVNNNNTITLTTNIKNSEGVAIIDFPDNLVKDGDTLKQLIISPAGFIFTAKQKIVHPDVPDCVVTVVFKDGTTEIIDIDFSLDINANPLLKEMYTDYAENNIIIGNGTFSRKVDVENIKEIILDNVTYPLN